MKSYKCVEFKVYEKNSGRTTNGHPVHAEIRGWYVGNGCGWMPDRFFSVFYGSEQEDFSALPWQIKKIWDGISTMPDKINTNPKFLKLLDSYERCEERRRLAAAKARAEEEARKAAEAAAKEAEETAIHGPMALGGYWLDMCRSGLFEGCATVRFQEPDKRRIRVDEALRKFKVVKGADGLKYIRNTKPGTWRVCNEEEAYDIICGNADMSFAHWGSYW